MSRIALVFGLMIGVAATGRAADFARAVPKADAPANAGKICEQMNARKEAEIAHESRFMSALLLRIEAEKKAPVYVNPPRGIGYTNAIWFRTKKDKEAKLEAREKERLILQARIDDLKKYPEFAEQFMHDIKVHDVGVVSHRMPIDEIVSDDLAIVEANTYEFVPNPSEGLPYSFLDIVRRRVMVKIDTTGLADGSFYETKEPLLVLGTMKHFGTTYFVLEPINLADYVEARKP